MILGAGQFQATAVRKAVDLGFHVITVDSTPNNPGHTFAHESVNCSTTDRVGVLQAARSLRIDGICTFSSDVAVPTLGFVCDQLNLPGPSVHIAETLSQKHLFRKFLEESGRRCPGYATASTPDDIAPRVTKLRFPLIAKPVDTSGSRGVSKINSNDQAALLRALQFALKYSRSGMTCFEEFVDGEEVGGDGVLIEGKFAFIAITHKHLREFVVTGHSLPSSLSPIDRARVKSELEQTCRTLGYLNGPLNFDVIVSPKAVTILEMAPRNGGNGIPSVVERHFGIDIETITLRMAMGQKWEEHQVKTPGAGCGSLVFGCATGGVVESLKDVETLKHEIPEIFDLSYAVGVGDRVQPFEHNGNSIGYALFDAEDADHYDRTVSKILASLDIVVKTCHY